MQTRIPLPHQRESSSLNALALARFNNLRSRRGNEAELTPEGPPPHVGGYSFPGTALALTALLLAPFIGFAAESSGVFNVLDYGAKGDGTNDDTAAVQKAIDACAGGGGGEVLLPAGTFLTGALTLDSGIDFHLANGAVLKGSANWRDYGHPGALLFAKDATNITVSGNGIIDGNDRAVWQQLANEEAGGDVNKTNWWPESFTGDWWPFDKLPNQPQTHGGRPMMVIFIGCHQVRMHDFTLRHASSWTVHLVGCHDVAIDN